MRMLTACNWSGVATLFTETPSPVMSDLADLLSTIVRTALHYSQDASEVVRVLLLEGLLPIKPDDDARYKGMVRALQRQAILTRVTLRHRSPGDRTKVVALRPEHLLLHEAVSDVLNGSYEPSS